MSQVQQVLKISLEQQLDWTKEQVQILDEMDIKLREMKKIAEYAAANKLSSTEMEKLNGQLNVLQTEVRLLVAQRHTVFG